MRLLDKLLNHRVVIVAGKGGVGKTTVTAALACIAAERGIDTLAIECDPGAPLAATFGKKQSFEPIEVFPHLATMILDGQHSLEEYLRLVIPSRIVLRVVLSSKLYQYFVQAAPGLRELMMLGKIYFEAKRRNKGSDRWQLFILDAPASGQALNLFKMPAAARETFGASIVGREADKINQIFHNERECALVQVTTPDSLALSETLETYQAFRALDFKVFSIILNRYVVDSFSKADLAKFARRSLVRSEIKHLDHLTAVARSALERSARARESLATLRKSLKSPLISLPELEGLAGSGLYRELASALLCDGRKQVTPKAPESAVR